MEANRLNLEASSPQAEQDKDRVLAKRKKMPKPNASLASVIDWIRRRGLDNETTNQLIKIAQGYPAGALNRFKEDYHRHIRAIRDKID